MMIKNKNFVTNLKHSHLLCNILKKKEFKFINNVGYCDVKFEKNLNKLNFYIKNLVYLGVGSLCVWFGFNKISSKKLKNNFLPIEDQNNVLKKYGQFKENLKTIKLSEVEKHNKKESRIWVTFQQGVYDITDFVDNHPGGEAILLAAGGQLEPFWEIYSNHNTDLVLSILEKYRIGNLEKNEVYKSTEKYDPYQNEPNRSSTLNVIIEKPFNAETPLSLLNKSFITPNEFFFVRNHLPVPDIKEEDYFLEIYGNGLKKNYKFKLKDLKKLPQHSVITTIQCAGNRRNELSAIKQIKGLNWKGGAISTCKWTGVKLVDLLNHIECDLKEPNIKHLQLEGYDFDVKSKQYAVSVQAQYALDANNEVLIAYKMNDSDIPRDHGYPVRFIAPGITGARNVKWLSKIVLSDKESDGHWQQKDYKGFTSDKNFDNVNFKKGFSIQQMPVQSVICEPENFVKIPLEKIIANNNYLPVSGYAWSGGGRKIIRVDVGIIDTNNKKFEFIKWHDTKLFGEDEYKKGKYLDTWFNQSKSIENKSEGLSNAQTNYINQDTFKSWAWVLWKSNLELDAEKVKKGAIFEIVCKATDSSYNTQPEQSAWNWNFRGVLNNAWYRVKIEIV